MHKHGLFISCNQEIKQNQLEEFLSTRMDDDMEMSDEEPSEPKKKKPDEPFNPQQLQEFCEYFMLPSNIHGGTVISVMNDRKHMCI